MAYVSLVFYIFIFVFFLHKIKQSRIYYLFIFFIIKFEDSAFINLKPIIGGPLSYPNLFFILLLFTWILINGKSSLRLKFYKCRETNLYMILLLILISQVIISHYGYGNSLFYVLRMFLSPFYYFAGFFIFISILIGFTKDEVLDFLYDLVFINTILMLGYIASSGFGLPVYAKETFYQTRFFEGGVVIRDFQNFPKFTMFSFCYLIAIKNRSFKTYLMLAITIIGTILMYTRSYLIPMIILPLVASFLLLYKNRKLTKSLRSFAFYFLIACLSLILISHYALPQFKYLLVRFGGSEGNYQLQQDGNFIARMNMIVRSFEIINDYNVILGVGFYNPGEISYSGAIEGNRGVMGDSSWPYIILHFGILGVIVFLSIIGNMFWSSFNIFKRHDRESEFIGLLFILVIIYHFILSFFCDTYYSNPVFVFWYFTIIVIEKYGWWKKNES